MTSTSVAAKERLRSLISHETLLYILLRLGQGLLTLFLVSVLSFAIIKMAPGDYAATLKFQNPRISDDRILEIQQQLGLDKSAIEQYFLWLWRVLRYGDFGPSIVGLRPVAPLIWERIPNTLLLSITSFLVTWAIAIPLGIMGAVNQNRASERILRVISYIGQGFPTFVAALLLLVVAQVTSPVFPVGGRTSINYDELSPLGQFLDVGWHLILPTIALSVTSFAGLQRITRGEFLDVLRQDYIQTARAKGLPENRVICVHALRNAINPLVTLLGFEFASLLSGAFIAEFFFAWPGLGRLTLEAVTKRDLYLVMASLMMGAVMLILGNLLADLLLKAVDPRIKLANLK
jgi:peptide/nickel transport system permease protein